MLLFLIAVAIVDPAPTAFPEQVPAMIESCLAEAIAQRDVFQTEDNHKYICTGDPAVRLWRFLEGAKVAAYEQDTPEGRWLSRDFPLGACFKRIRMADGGPLREGLSCTIWVPRIADPAPNRSY